MLLQLRVGGQAARSEDETWPLECGCVGQETTGAGGLAKALRTVPVVLDIAERVRRANPDAWIVDFTNPVGIVTRALLQDGHRAIGLCNVAIGFQRRFAALLGVEPERVGLDHVGLNHLTWERAVLRRRRRRAARSCWPSTSATIAADIELPATLIERLGVGAVVLPALLLRPRRGGPRAADPGRRARPRWPRSSSGCSSCTPTRPLDEKPAQLANAAARTTPRRRSRWSRRCSGRVPGTDGGARRQHRATTARCRSSPDDDVIEVPARVDAPGARARADRAGRTAVSPG